MAAAVTLVDLGMGNITSVLRALDRAGARAERTSDPDVVRRAKYLVVPGQGHFADGARALSGPLGEALEEAIAAGQPFLGICLGLQLLFEASDEAEGMAGLGVFHGRVRRLADGQVLSGRPRKVPHMGWNQVEARHPLLRSGEWFYFVHSFHAVPSDPSVLVATADYGEPVCAAVAKDNVFACQFHPEKSGAAGIQLLADFVEGRWLGAAGRA